VSEDGTKMHREPSVVAGSGILEFSEPPLSYRERMLVDMEDMRIHKTHEGILVHEGKFNNGDPTLRKEIENSLSKKKKVSLS